MTKQDKYIAALTTAAKKQADPVKRRNIIEKIKQIQGKKVLAEWLGR